MAFSVAAKMSSSSSSRVLFWNLDDEQYGRQYEVRISYQVESWEPGDFVTPGYGGEAVLDDLEVVQVRHYDSQGNVTGVDLGEAARRYDNRAWALIESNADLHQRIEEACSRRESLPQ